MQALYDRYEKADWTAAMTRKQPNYEPMVDQLDKLYQGNHSPMTGPTGYLAQIFPQSYAGGRLALNSVPMVPRFVNTSAQLFHARPSWLLTRDGEEVPPDDQDSKRWKDLAKETRWDSRCRVIQRRDVLWGTVFARPAWRSDQMKIDVLKPSTVQVIESPDDPSDLNDAVAISVVLDANRREVWERPNADNGFQWLYGVMDTKEKTITDPLFGGTFINQYGRYPFVAFSTYPCETGVYATCDQTLLDQQIAADLAETWADFQFRMGFSIAVIKTTKDLGKEELPVGPDMLVQLMPGGDEEFARVASGLDTGQLTAFIEGKFKRYAALRGIDPDILSTDGKQMIASLTGVAKQMERTDLQELREDAAIPYEDLLPELFDATRTVHNYHRPDLRISEDLVLEVRWAEPQVPGNALQDAQADQMRLEQGVITPEEIRARKEGRPVEEVTDG